MVWDVPTDLVSCPRILEKLSDAPLHEGLKTSFQSHIVQGDVSAAFQDFVAAFENSAEHASTLAGCGPLPGKFKGRGKARLIPSSPPKFTASVDGTLLADQRM